MPDHNLIIQGRSLAPSHLRTLLKLAHAHSHETVDAMAIRFVQADVTAAPAVAAYCEQAQLDFGYVKAGMRLGDFGLIAMDMDSTLITIECIDEIADFAGLKEQVAAVTAASMRGEIDWPQSLRQRVALLKGLDESALQRVYEERLQLSPGAEQLILAAQRQGIKLLLVSGGFTYFTERLKQRLGIDYAFSNLLEIEKGRITGRVTGELLDAVAKAAHVARVRDELGLTREQLMVIGDGANDLGMLAETNFSVAFHAKPVVRREAAYAINYSGLDALLNLFPAECGVSGKGK